MRPYHKIDSIYQRDPATNNKTFIDGAWSRPEFGYLAACPWVFTEKIDGTNVRVGFDTDDFRGRDVTFGGRTDDAQMPAHLSEHLRATFTVDTLGAVFAEPRGVVLYGEGYGAKIQKHGEKYRADAGFILFDVRVGDIWLERPNVEDIAAKLGIPVAPIVGHGTLYDALDIVRAGFDSTCAAETRQAEGLVVRPAVELLDRRGERIITKIKHKDFAFVAPKVKAGEAPA